VTIKSQRTGSSLAMHDLLSAADRKIRQNDSTGIPARCRTQSAFSRFRPTARQLNYSQH
jgi:hypothetical protein